MPHLLRGSALALALVLVLAAPPLAAQTAEPDTAALRHALVRALGGDFEVARTELRVHNGHATGTTYWLAHVRPLRGGSYALGYRYAHDDRADPGDPLFTHVEHTSRLRVGESGCGRLAERVDACVGDTVILPVVVRAKGGHVFFPVQRSALPDLSTPAAVEPLPEDTDVPNPAATHLRYLGSRLDIASHRAGGEGTASSSALFEAASPGAFTLALGDPAARGRELHVPVVVVPRGTPVTVILAREQVRSYHEGTGFASNHGNTYPTSLVLLQPGDRVSLGYREARVSLGTLDPDAAPTPPTLAVLPYALDANARFNAWLPQVAPRGAPGIL